ncbi:MAG: 23S rRNA pseudouridine(1911/1915/1917) synthase RluD [Gammaproteobacteria bacterium]|nr:23S rRNA pseudouridine(1911/1915/1917) synthase RluD [Gammaproteobacteria bacterium]
MSSPQNLLQQRIPDEYAGWRLDQVLSEMFSDYSRSRLQQWIKDGQVTVDGVVWRPRDKVTGGEAVELRVEVQPQERWQAQAIPLHIVYEDESIIVLNKPAGMVVHPAAGNPDGTLLNALLHHEPDLARVPRAGIVHRLDKETSGIMVVARNLKSQTSLVEQLQSRSLSRQYQCVVQGVMTGGGKIDAPISRHPVDRKRMAVVRDGKQAITHYRVMTRFRAHTHVSVKLETGRTHQIRVHMAHIHYPIVGDPVYGGRLKLPASCTDELVTVLREFRRQALHAYHLGLVHPETGEVCEWQVELPDDMQALIAALERDRQDQGGDK